MHGEAEKGWHSFKAHPVSAQSWVVWSQGPQHPPSCAPIEAPEGVRPETTQERRGSYLV